MNYSEIFAELCKYAPISLSDDIVKLENGYDNSGVIIGNLGEIENILFCLDLTARAVKDAVENGCNLIVTHHPAVYRPIKNITETSTLAECIRNNIAVISMHLNLDCAKYGIDYRFAEGLGGKNIRIIESLGEDVGYGRVADADGVTAIEFLKRYEKTFNTKRVELYGDKDREIKKFASFCGAGLGEGELLAAIENGVDLVASADIPHHVLLSALENGLCVLSCTHYATENYGMRAFAEYANGKFKNKKIFFFDDERLA